MKPLSQKQRNLMALIDAYRHRCGRSPSVRTLCAIFRHSTNSLQGRLDRLVRDGYLSREPGKCRTLQVARRWDGDRVLIRGQWFRFEVVGTEVAG